MLLDVSLEILALEFDDAEHQRHRLHQAVGPPHLGRCARLHGDVAVAGAIDGDARADRERPGLGLEHRAFDAFITQDAAREGVKHEVHAGLVEELERDQLEPLRIERHDVAGGERGLDGAARLHQALEQRLERAGDDRLAGSVVRRQQGGGALLLLRRVRGMERHERHDERGGRVAAEKTVALGEHDSRAGLRGA